MGARSCGTQLDVALEGVTVQGREMRVAELRRDGAYVSSSSSARRGISMSPMSWALHIRYTKVEAQAVSHPAPACALLPRRDTFYVSTCEKTSVYVGLAVERKKRWRGAYQVDLHAGVVSHLNVDRLVAFVHGVLLCSRVPCLLLLRAQGRRVRACKVRWKVGRVGPGGGGG